MDKISWSLRDCSSYGRQIIDSGEFLLPANATIESACNAVCVFAKVFPKSAWESADNGGIRAEAIHPRSANREKWLEIEFAFV